MFFAVRALDDAGGTFAGRAEIYRGMQAQLDAAGIDTVWFGVAADLNDFFAARSNLLATSGEFLNDLGVSLLADNTNAFSALLSGDISLRGQALDNFLVNKEQMLVQGYLQNHFGSSVPIPIRAPVNLAFSVGRFGMRANIRNGISFVESRHGGLGSFNFWDTWHCIELGQSMMSQARHGM